MLPPDQIPAIAAPLLEVETERLDLRRFRVEDLEELADVFAHREVWEFPFGRGFSREETQAFIGRQVASWDQLGFGVWVVRTRDKGAIIGYAGLSVPTFFPEILPAVEVGWRLAPSEWGKGFATEAACAALDQGFTVLDLEIICSLPQSENRRSSRVAERLGMTLSGEATLAANDRRGEVSVLHYEISRSHWLATPRRATS
jgi:RimJ/RimL family protein N-acetyltransferase